MSSIDRMYESMMNFQEFCSYNFCEASVTNVLFMMQQYKLLNINNKKATSVYVVIHDGNYNLKSLFSGHLVIKNDKNEDGEYKFEESLFIIKDVKTIQYFESTEELLASYPEMKKKECMKRIIKIFKRFKMWSERINENRFNLNIKVNGIQSIIYYDKMSEYIKSDLILYEKIEERKRILEEEKLKLISNPKI